MLRIGEFSKLTKTTVKALRYYDSIGLLKPAFVNKETSYRYYLEEQVETAQRIQVYRAAGISCENMLKFLQNEADNDLLLCEHRRGLEKMKRKIEEQLEILKTIEGERAEQVYSPVVEKIEECIVYYSRSFIKDTGHIMHFIKETMAELARTNPAVGFGKPDYCCVIYPDDGYRESDIFVEYVQSVDKMGEDTPIIKFKTLEAITAISVKHCGRYENLRNAYLSAVNYAIANGLEIAGNARERFIKGAWNCESEEEWETIIQIPVKLG